MHPIIPNLSLVTPRNPVPEITVPNCAVYVVVDDATLLLIDAGNGFSHHSVLDALAEHGLPGKREAYLLLTHCHIDHAGGGAYLRRAMTICASALGAEILSTGSRHVWYEAPELVIPYPIDLVLHPGTRRFGSFAVDILATPGHTDDSLTYILDINGQRCVFSGDVIMPDGTPGWQGSVDYHPDKLYASLRLLAQHPFDYLLTGHGYVGHEGYAMVKAQAVYHTRTKESSCESSS